jgi:hypothetical protein
VGSSARDALPGTNGEEKPTDGQEAEKGLKWDEEQRKLTFFPSA